MTWEYRTIYIGLGNVRTPDGRTVSDWYVDWSDAPPTIGLNEILNSQGAQGWELVNMVVEYYIREVVSENLRAKRYRAVFKRPVSGAAVTAREEAALAQV